MIACDPERPESFNAVLPQLTRLLDGIRRLPSLTGSGGCTNVSRCGARGEWTGSIRPPSIFRIAQRETSCIGRDDGRAFWSPDIAPDRPRPSIPTVVVMRNDHSEEKGLSQAWRDLRDRALPLVVCRDAAGVREQLARNIRMHSASRPANAGSA